MFKRKKKKTGTQIPPQYNPPPMPPVKPPKPPTSGSNAVKPSYNCGHQPTYTSTQNPPNTFSSLLKATSVQILPNDISVVTYICPYETPCGYCTKWDKKCDKKIGRGIINNKPQRGLRAHGNMYDDAMSPCVNCIEKDKVFNLCVECGGAPEYKNFREKEH